MGSEENGQETVASSPLRYSKVVVDASVWVSRLMPQGNNHARSVEWLRQYTAAGGLLVAPSFLLIEASSAVTRQIGRATAGKHAADYISRMSEMSFVPLDDAFIQKAADLAADLHLRAGDAVYVTVAYLMGIPLVSWDKEQIRRASGRVVGFAPDSFPL